MRTKPASSRTRRKAKAAQSDFSLDLIPSYDCFRDADAYWFDEDAAERAIAFFSECLTFTAGQWRGQPFDLQPWQKAVTAALFGWKRRDGTRRYREAFVLVARKAGKVNGPAGLAAC